MTAAMSGRATARDSMRPRTLVCTTDGIWLWPGTALTERRGAALVPIPTPQLYQQVAMLHGPAVHAAALARGIERAAACLSQGRLPVGGRAEAVRRILEGLARLWRSLRRLPKPSEPSEPASSPPSEPLPEDAAQEPPPRATPGAEEEKPPGIGHNGPPIETVPDVEPPKPAPPVPPSDWPFEMPVEAPADSKDISLYGRRVSNAIREALKNNDEKTLKEIGDAVSKAPWLSDQIDNILADQDQPRDLDELIERAKPGARPGYNLHHIVEQGPQNKDIPDAQIEAPDNIALVPTYKHWQITAYYRRGKNPEFGGLSPREGLKGKTFQEKYDFGIKVLKVFGVLK